MKPLSFLVLLLWPGFLFTPLRAADEARPAVKTGGHFEVEVIKDLAYREGEGADPVKNKLDLYLPKGQKDFPVLFFVHGGSWRSGDRKIYGPLGSVFAQNGIGTVVISYRLSPAVQHPAHIQDVARAFAWAQANIGKHGGKADAIFVSGHSAGGHLVALLATDESYLKAEKLSFANLKGVIPLSGVYRIVPGLSLFEKAFGKDEEVLRQASPLEHVAPSKVPFLLIYAEKDLVTLDRMAEQMCQALQKNKCEASTLKVKGRDHISIIRQATKEEDPATQAMLEFIASHSGLKLSTREAQPEGRR